MRPISTVRSSPLPRMVLGPLLYTKPEPLGCCLSSMLSSLRTRTAMLLAGEKTTEIDSPLVQANVTFRSACADGVELHAQEISETRSTRANAFMVFPFNVDSNLTLEVRGFGTKTIDRRSPADSAAPLDRRVRQIFC